MTRRPFIDSTADVGAYSPINQAKMNAPANRTNAPPSTSLGQIMKKPRAIKDLPAELQLKIATQIHKDKIRSTIKKKGIKGAPDSIQYNRDYLLYAIKQDFWSWQDIPTNFQNDPKFALQAVKANWRVYRFLQEPLRAQKEIALAAVQQWPDSIKHVPASLLQDEPEIALTAVGHKGVLLEEILATKGLVLSKKRMIALLKAAKNARLFNLDYCQSQPQRFPLMLEAYTRLQSEVDTASQTSL